MTDDNLWQQCINHQSEGKTHPLVPKTGLFYYRIHDLLVLPLAMIVLALAPRVTHRFRHREEPMPSMHLDQVILGGATSAGCPCGLRKYGTAVDCTCKYCCTSCIFREQFARDQAHEWRKRYVHPIVSRLYTGEELMLPP